MYEMLKCIHVLVPNQSTSSSDSWYHGASTANIIWPWNGMSRQNINNVTYKATLPDGILRVNAADMDRIITDQDQAKWE